MKIQENVIGLPICPFQQLQMLFTLACLCMHELVAESPEHKENQELIELAGLVLLKRGSELPQPYSSLTLSIMGCSWFQEQLDAEGSTWLQIRDNMISIRDNLNTPSSDGNYDEERMRQFGTRSDDVRKAFEGGE